AVFEAGTDRATPAGVAGRGEQRTAAESGDLVLVADHSGTTLDVDQDVVPGVPDLAGDQTERIDLGAVARGEQRARVVAREIGPVALAFDAEHPLAGLPAIADL